MKVIHNYKYNIVLQLNYAANASRNLYYECIIL